MGFIEDSFFLVLSDNPKSTQVFLDIATGHIKTKLILGRLQIMESTWTIFLEEVFTSNGFSGAYDFYSNNHEVFHTDIDIGQRSPHIVWDTIKCYTQVGSCLTHKY